MGKRLMGSAAPAVVVAALALGAAQVARAGGERGQGRLDRLDAARPAAATEANTGPYGVAQGVEESAAAARFAEAANGRQFEVYVLAAKARADEVAADAVAQTQTARSGGGRRSGGCTESSIIVRESKGDPGAVNPRTGAGGLYQFLPSTWAGYGGYASAADAPADVQKQRFDQLWAGGAGSSHWSC
jgi:hypothetical protein